MFSHAMPIEERAFCLLLLFTGCRISEALELTGAQIDFDGGYVILRSLKKRANNKFRMVPVPDEFIKVIGDLLDMSASNDRVWQWGRTKGWQVIKRVMSSAGIEGPHACPKGLRHGFGVAAIRRGVPLNLVQRWLGHRDLATTAIYADVVGDDEREIAARFWPKSP